MSGQCFLHATHGVHWDVRSPLGIAAAAGSVWIFSTRPTGHTKLHHVFPAYTKLVTTAASTTAPKKPASQVALPFVARSRSARHATMIASCTSR